MKTGNMSGIIQPKTNNQMNSIKSKFILQKIFYNLLYNKKLNIMKYNKNMQKRMELTLKDYKEYSSIEIYIKPVINKYGNFINIKKGDEKYYHIYFNNNEKEIKRSYINKDEAINTIKIMIDFHINSLKELFLNCDCIESICFKNFNRENINDMGGMFCGCSSVKEINFNSFNSINVKDMSYMFYGCSSLNALNLNNVKADNVKDMSYMFGECSSLIGLNLDNFNTNNVMDMSYMFYKCSSLKGLNLKNVNTHNVTKMDSMFSGCSSLK